MGTNAKHRVRTLRQIGLIVAVVLIAVGGLSAYVWYRLQPTLMNGSFVTSAGAPLASFRFEVRNTCQGRQEGLMFRRAEDFPADRAMLFLFPRTERQSFWMLNTLIPLDMIFLNRDFVVEGVLPNVPPLNRESRSIDKLSQFVVEVNAGVAQTAGIGAGSKLVMKGDLPPPQECVR